MFKIGDRVRFEGCTADNKCSHREHNYCHGYREKILHGKIIGIDDDQCKLQLPNESVINVKIDAVKPYSQKLSIYKERLCN